MKNYYSIVMKIIYQIVCYVLVFFFSLPLAAQSFTVAASSLSVQHGQHQKKYESFPRPPYLTVYQQGNKKLVLLAARHGAESLPAVQYAFDTYSPQIVLVEREPRGTFLPCTEAEDGYTAVLASRRQIPLVRADLSQEQQWSFVQKGGFSYDGCGLSGTAMAAHGKPTGRSQPPRR